MRGRFQRYGFCVHALCGGLLTMAVMVLPKTLHAGDGHGSDGSGRAAPLVEIEPLSPAWYIETIRRLLHAGRARESYQMARLAADRHPRSVDVRLAAAYAAAASGRCVLAKRHLAQITGDMTTLWQSRRRDSLLASCDGPWQRRVVLAAGERYLPADMVVRRGVPAGDIILTMREHDVLSGLRSGLSNKEIADNLSLSEVTVKHHIKSLRGKLGARNRVHAVCRANELDIR